ncbi:SEC-C metal-binding domain-containing protein [Streptomyces sp. NBC_00828]|uniref:SEC-C metal-binding domain-containing protein n=1 Tax=Streptomyces sp. NBC_00828 TaxID=2903678 RepID=UPI00386E0B4E
MTRPRVRIFPDDAEVDDWITAHLVADETDFRARTPVAEADQKIAAVRETGARTRAAMPMIVASENAAWAVTGASDRSGLLTRQAVRMYLAAESAGIAPLCPHTDQIRPLFLMCDPAVVMCNGCVPEIAGLVEEKLRKTGFLWDNECDICGRRGKGMYPTTLTLAHFTIAGNVCPSCHDHARREAHRQAESVVLVGRKQPCPCGSGRRYKHCHGKNQDH